MVVPCCKVAFRQAAFCMAEWLFKIEIITEAVLYVCNWVCGFV